MEASSAVNAPHPDDTEEDFFADKPDLPTLTDEQAKAEAERYAAERGEGRIEPVNEGGQPDGSPSPLQDAAEGQPAPASVPAEEQPQAPAGEPTGAAEPPHGSPEREYTVLQRVSLTETLLKHLLEEVRSGNVAEARTAFLELDRTTARNDRQAIGDTYKTHRARLGEMCDLAAVTTRSFKIRHVEPRPQVREDLNIT